MVNHMIAASTNVFFTVCPLGRAFLEYAKTIPNNAQIDIPRIPPANI